MINYVKTLRLTTSVNTSFAAYFEPFPPTKFADNYKNISVIAMAPDNEISKKSIKLPQIFLIQSRPFMLSFYVVLSSKTQKPKNISRDTWRTDKSLNPTSFSAQSLAKCMNSSEDYLKLYNMTVLDEAGVEFIMNQLSATNPA